jgi:hypothetical protein
VLCHRIMPGTFVIRRPCGQCNPAFEKVPIYVPSRKNQFVDTHIHIYVCMCACVCICNVCACIYVYITYILIMMQYHIRGSSQSCDRDRHQPFHHVTVTVINH